MRAAATLPLLTHAVLLATFFACGCHALREDASRVAVSDALGPLAAAEEGEVARAVNAVEKDRVRASWAPVAEQWAKVEQMGAVWTYMLAREAAGRPFSGDDWSFAGNHLQSAWCKLRDLARPHGVTLEANGCD